MTADDVPGGRAARPSPMASRQISEEDLEVLSPRAGGVRDPQLLLPGDGRILFNTSAVYCLTGDRELGAVKLYLYRSESNGRRLVVRAATRDEPDVVRVVRTGGRRKSKAWPSTVMARATVLLRSLGLVERCRLVGEYDRERGWLVFDLDNPLPYETRRPRGS